MTAETTAILERMWADAAVELTTYEVWTAEAERILDERRRQHPRRRLSVRQRGSHTPGVGRTPGDDRLTPRSQPLFFSAKRPTDQNDLKV